MKSPRLLRLSEGHRSQKRAQSITTTEAALQSRDIAAITIVLVSIRGRFMRRPGGFLAIMIMRPVNWGVGIPGIGVGRVPTAITGTELLDRR